MAIVWITCYYFVNHCIKLEEVGNKFFEAFENTLQKL